MMRKPFMSYSNLQIRVSMWSDWLFTLTVSVMWRPSTHTPAHPDVVMEPYAHFAAHHGIAVVCTPRTGHPDTFIIMAFLITYLFLSWHQPHLYMVWPLGARDAKLIGCEFHIAEFIRNIVLKSRIGRGYQPVGYHPSMFWQDSNLIILLTSICCLFICLCEIAQFPIAYFIYNRCNYNFSRSWICMRTRQDKRSMPWRVISIFTLWHLMAVRY